MPILTQLEREVLYREFSDIFAPTIEEGYIGRREMRQILHEKININPRYQKLLPPGISALEVFLPEAINYLKRLGFREVYIGSRVHGYRRKIEV